MLLLCFLWENNARGAEILEAEQCQGEPMMSLLLQHKLLLKFSVK